MLLLNLMFYDTWLFFSSKFYCLRVLNEYFSTYSKKSIRCSCFSYKNIRYLKSQFTRNSLSNAVLIILVNLKYVHLIYFLTYKSTIHNIATNALFFDPKWFYCCQNNTSFECIFIFIFAEVSRTKWWIYC